MFRGQLLRTLGFNQCLVGILFVVVCLALPAPAFPAGAQQDVQALRSVKVISIDEVGSELRFPSGIAYDRDADEIYVTSPQKNKLVVLTPDYFPYLSIGSGRGLNSISKSFIRDGLLYVCLGASTVEPRPHIAVFDMAFMPVKQIFFPDFERFSPLGIVVAKNGRIYVVGMNGTGVMVLNSDGKFLHWIEPKDEVLEVVEKASILALDIGIDGRLYFLSESMGRVFVYGPDEKFLYRFGEKGGEPGKLSRPRGIAVDDSRRQVYLVDYQRHTMSIYSMSGEYLFEIGGMGRSRGWFYYPSDLIVDGQGRIVVADTFNHRLQVFEFVSSRGFGAKARDIRIEPVSAPKVTDIIHIRSLKQAVQTERPGDFLVVTGLVKRQEEAAAQLLQLSRKGYPVQIQILNAGKSGIWHRVFVGPYVDPLKAYAVARQLQQDEQLPAVLKTRGKAYALEISSKDGVAEDGTVEQGLETSGQPAPAPAKEVEKLQGEPGQNPFVPSELPSAL